ncbi:hypothetical protein AB0K21_38555 [Streptosporangium sp. NPDC049248]|uniref:hypothetical protein n=1 Tax=Streptosporangium sp. NPDC049248 TaxID=3155651 RepID=UPI003440087B
MTGLVRAEPGEETVDLVLGAGENRHPGVGADEGVDQEGADVAGASYDDSVLAGQFRSGEGHVRAFLTEPCRSDLDQLGGRKWCAGLAPRDERLSWASMVVTAGVSGGRGQCACW